MLTYSHKRFTVRSVSKYGSAKVKFYRSATSTRISWAVKKPAEWVKEEREEKVVILVAIAEVVETAADVVVDLVVVTVAAVVAAVDKVAAEEDNVRMCRCANVQMH